MYVLKSFISHALFANNNPGVVSQIGELSTQSLTYSKEIGSYTSSTSPNLTLVSFKSALDTTQITVAPIFADHVLDVAKFIYDKSISTNILFDTDTMLSSLLAAFIGVAENFQMGAAVHDGSYYIPEWLSWDMVVTTGVVENSLKIWFSDNSFQNEYDEYSITVVPPTDNLDNFFMTGTDVETMLKVFSDSENMNRIQTAKNGHPDTLIRLDSYNYIDPSNSSHVVPSKWAVIIYGKAGDNADSVSDALVNYILTHSTNTRAAWTSILPDLFRRTEFVIAPMWDQYAIPNRTLQAGIYSPIANLTRASTLIKQVAIGYSNTHINTNASVASHPYKSLALLSVGSADNRNSLFKLTDVFPDYISVSSTSLDFNRMSLLTQNWMLILEDMLIVAEGMSDFTSIPIGYSKMKRNNILFLTKRYDNINYLVATKASISAISGI